MRLKGWCKHIRPVKQQQVSSGYEWFDSSLQAWRPLAEVWRRCPVCKKPAPSAQRPWWRMWTVWLSFFGMLVLFTLIGRWLRTEPLAGIRWLP